jgi:ABC-type spermidine/putrescine transport system permease subunit II
VAGRISGHATKVLAVALTTGVLAFLYLPIAVVVIFSFNASARLSLPIESLSFRWYEEVLADPVFRDAIVSSTIVGAAAATSTALLGTLATFALVRAPRRLRGPLAVLFFAPITLPGLFLGLSLLSLFAQLDVSLSLYTVAAAHFVYTFPYFLLIARAALERLDPQLDELGADLGAGSVERFRRITFPLVWPILAAAAVLAFALSFDEFIITFFVIGTESTVPMVVWSAARRTIDPSINALATLLLLVTIVGTIATVALLAARRYARRAVIQA